MGNQQPKMTIKAKGRGPMPVGFMPGQMGPMTGVPMGYPTTTTVRTVGVPPQYVPPPVVPTYPVAAPMATTITETASTMPMLPPRLPAVPYIEYPMQPGVFTTVQAGPSMVETHTVQQPPYIATPMLDETFITATAPPTPSPMRTPQQSPQMAQMTYTQAPPPLPVGYEQVDELFTSGRAQEMYATDNEREDDTDSYTSYEEEIYTAPPRRPALSTYSRQQRSPNYSPNYGTASVRSARSSPPLALSGSLSARRFAAYDRYADADYADASYDRYAYDRFADSGYDHASTIARNELGLTRSLAYDRYQDRVNSRVSLYRPVPDANGFYPNAYHI